MPSGASRRTLAILAVGAATILAAPAACLFPSYSFDLSSTGGGSSASSTSTSTATSTATASSSQTSTSSSASSGGTGGTGGAPNTCDTDPDCSNTLCQADYECVDPVPAGWGVPGYVALYDGTASVTPPPCPTGVPTPVYTGNITPGPQTTCTQCGCTAPTGQDCELTTDLDPVKMGIQAVQVSNAGCNMAATELNTLTVPDPPWGGACFHDEMLPGGQLCNGLPCNTSVTSSLPTVSGGMCAATGGSPNKPPVTWATAAIACSGAKMGKGCTNGQVCVPKVPSPFKAHVCVEQTGDVPCPTGSSFSNKSTYYGSFDDGRACSACSCGPVNGGGCEITFSLWSDQTVGVCSSVVTSFKAGQCAALSGNPGIYGWTDLVTKAPSGGSCSPIGSSVPTGQLTQIEPTTFCCQ